VREDLETIKTVSQIVRLETGLFGLDAGPEVAAESEARPILIQVDGGDPKRLEELTEEELLKYVATLKHALDKDNGSDPG
jgi:hypothetical protein